MGGESKGEQKTKDNGVKRRGRREQGLRKNNQCVGADISAGRVAMREAGRQCSIGIFSNFLNASFMFDF